MKFTVRLDPESDGRWIAEVDELKAGNYWKVFFQHEHDRDGHRRYSSGWTRSVGGSGMRWPNAFLSSVCRWLIARHWARLVGAVSLGAILWACALM